MSYKRLTPCIFIAGGKAVIMQTEQMNCLYLIFQILMKIMKNPSI